MSIFPSRRTRGGRPSALCQKQALLACWRQCPVGLQRSWKLLSDAFRKIYDFLYELCRCITGSNHRTIVPSSLAHTWLFLAKFLAISSACLEHTKLWLISLSAL
ncbi:hypothetical protein WA026_016641 [Henosepilachna vigintioctopunctata]|uniref:Uncharacterized protein n=1 Tax=Henosepilachna vigintioctopunctata TaxID=420089 RepID=A0AAW1VHT3_9CUCU